MAGLSRSTLALCVVALAFLCAASLTSAASTANNATNFDISGYTLASTGLLAGITERAKCADNAFCGEQCCYDSWVNSWYCCAANRKCTPQQTSDGCSD